MSTTISPIIVITGATSGIGHLAAIDLAKQGAHLVLIARNADKAESTRILIDQAASGNNKCDVFLADLTLMDDVRRVGREIATRYERVDVLINNAGIQAFDQRVTKDGFPEMMAVNYLSPWLLTHTLRDALIRSGSNARIMNVASEASKRHGVLTLPDDLVNTTPFTMLRALSIYGKTKLLDIMFTQHLARELAGTGVSANALCPGFNVTNIGHELWFGGMLKRVLEFFRVGDPRRGAGIIVHMALDPGLGGKTGGYYDVDATLQTPVAPGEDVELQERLWDLTRGLLEKWL